MAGLLDKLNSKSGDNIDRKAPQVAASEEEQGFYNSFIKNGLRLIHSEKGMKAALKMISNDPVGGLAQAVVAVLSRLTDTAKSKGIELPEEVVHQGALELLAELGELAEEAGIHKYEEGEIEAAVGMALSIFTLNQRGGNQGGPQMMAGPQPQPAGAPMPGDERQGMLPGGGPPQPGRV